jgi:hypothetical protein
MSSRPDDVAVRVHGVVPPAVAGAIAGLIAQTYERLRSPPRPALELRLAGTHEAMAALAGDDKARHGITTAGDERFTCTHDAFEDRPRITVCVAALGDLAPQAVAAIRHEVGHAVLHGRRVFYEARIEAALREAGVARGLADHVLLQLLFFVAVAVKDWEVSRLLLGHGFADDVRALAWELLAPSEDDRQAWQMVERVVPLQLLWAAGQLKPLLHAAPLRDLPDRAEVERRAAEMLACIPPPRREALLALAWHIAAQLTDDTRANVHRAAERLLAQGF